MLIEKANALWDERNTEAVKRGEVELPRMLPLIRLKVIPPNAQFEPYLPPWYGSLTDTAISPG